MTSQQDTDRLKKSLDKLYNIKGDCDPEIAQALGTLRQLINEEFVHTNTQITTQNLYDVLYPKLTSWKDKEVIEAYEKGKYDGAREWAKVQAIENSSMHKSCVMPCCLSLQSQGGKNE